MKQQTVYYRRPRCPKYHEEMSKYNLRHRPWLCCETFSPGSRHDWQGGKFWSFCIITSLLAVTLNDQPKHREDANCTRKHGYCREGCIS